MKISNGNTIASTLTSMSPQVDYGTPIGVALQSVDATLAQNNRRAHHGRRCSSIDAQTTQLYFKASDGVALTSALVMITNQTCCGCNVPN